MGTRRQIQLTIAARIKVCHFDSLNPLTCLLFWNGLAQQTDQRDASDCAQPDPKHGSGCGPAKLIISNQGHCMECDNTQGTAHQ